MADTARLDPGRGALQRTEGFARYFAGYMGLSSILTAALPIPVTSFGLIPTYAAHTKFLSVYTSLFCFLLLGFVFYSRHTLAKWMFRQNSKRKALMKTLPLTFIVATLVCVFAYHITLYESVFDARTQLQINDPEIDSTASVLAKADYMEVPRKFSLIASYLGIFIMAEAAFILMATREYLQDLLGLTDVQLATQRY